MAFYLFWYFAWPVRAHLYQWTLVSPKISAIYLMPIAAASRSSQIKQMVTLCSSGFEVPFQTAVLFSALDLLSETQAGCASGTSFLVCENLEEVASVCVLAFLIYVLISFAQKSKLSWHMTKRNWVENLGN